MKKLIITATFIAGFLFCASGQTTFTSYLNSFIYSGSSFLISPRAVIQLPDSSYRLLTKSKNNGLASYVNSVTRITKNGVFDTAVLIQAPVCYHGFIPKLAHEFKGSFVYFDVPDNCTANLLSKLDSNGKSIWQKNLGWYVQNLSTISDTMIGATDLNGDFYILNTDCTIVKYKPNMPIFQIHSDRNNGYYASTYSNTFIRLDKDFNKVREKHDSLTNTQLNGVNYEFNYSTDNKLVAIYSNKTKFTPNGWNQYYIVVLDTLFNLIEMDSISMSSNTSSSSFVRALADGSYLIVCPSESGFIKIMKINKFLDIQFDFKLTTQLVYKYFDTYPLAIYARECIKTLDGGFLLSLNLETGPYGHTTLLMKFDSLGNFYWPFATGQKKMPEILHTVYPNPVQNNLTFELNETEIYQLIITNSSGQLVYKKFVKDKEEVETCNWLSGIYFYQLIGKEKISTGKFVKM